MKATRRRFSREFKLEAVRQLAAGSGLADADVARALGVMPRWCGAGSSRWRGTPRRRFPATGGRRRRRWSCSGCGGR